MTGGVTSSVALAVASSGSAEQHSQSVGDRVDDIDALLTAIAISCRESVVRFEDAVSRITEIVVRHAGHNDRALVMALQNFDRLQQEFATLGEVVARVSNARDRMSAPDAFCRDVIASVTIAELQERLAYHFQTVVENPDQLADSEEVEF